MELAHKNTAPQSSKNFLKNHVINHHKISIKFVDILGNEAIQINTHRNLSIDVINYVAVSLLEKTGNFEPTEKEIVSFEKILNKSITNGLKDYLKKINKLI